MPQTSRPNQPRAVPPLDSAQIASSNETVNAFLGGRTPSWMTGGSSADTTSGVVRPPSTVPRKRGLPRKYHTTPTNAAAPPTLDEDAQPRESIPINQLLDQTAGAAETNRTSAVLPSPAPTDAPSPNVSTQADCPSTAASASAGGTESRQPILNNDIAQDSTRAVPGTAARPVHAGASSPHVQAHAPPRGPGTEPVRSVISTDPVLPSTIPQATALPSSLPANRQASPHLSTRPRTNVDEPAANVSGHQAKRRRVEGQYTVDEPINPNTHAQWLGMIARRVAQFDSAGLLNDSVERPRYRILMEACENADTFYIALHQIFCGWSLNKPAIHNIYHGIMEPTRIDAAFDTLQSILRRNEDMSNAHLKWFTNFPMPMAYLCTEFRGYPVAQQITRFLIRLTSNWQLLMQGVRQRKYPLLAFEMSSVLCCCSRVLQAMFFTVSRRSLHIQDGAVASMMNDIFDKDRVTEASLNAHSEPTEEVKRARDLVISQYTRIIQHQQQQQLQQPQQQHMRQLAQQATPNTMASPAINQNNSVLEQPGRQLVTQSPVVPSNVSIPSPTAALSPAMSQFDALASRTLIGDRRVSSPAAANHYPPPGSPAMQGSRRPSQLYIQTDSRAHLSSGYQSPQLQQALIPGPASAGLSHPTGNESPNIQHIAFSSSNGQPRTPVLPPSASPAMLQRRASSTAYPSQYPSAHGGSLQHPTPQPHYVGQQVQTGTRSVTQQTQLMHPHQANQPWTAYSTPMAPQEQARRASFASQAAQQRLTFTIPESDYPFSPYGQASLQVGLHLVGLRSPRRVPSTPVRTRYYQFVKQFALGPLIAEPKGGLRNFTFIVPEEHMRSLSRRRGKEDLPFCFYSEGSYRYRLRLCMRPDEEAEVKEQDWVLFATHWPPHIFFDFNHGCMELRRKQHFHKDQPLELTDFVVEGKNTLRFSFPNVPQNLRRGFKYFVAVEIVETISHDTAKAVIQTTRRIPAEETKQKIQRRLCPSDSDDIIVEDETLAVSLADPFSATRFSIPVRGAHCMHLECFDLETWLQTRPRKPEQKGGGPSEQGAEPSQVDVWKCPICGLDARPSSLWVDEYLAGVGHDLLAKGDERTKAITISANGEWAAVQEPDDSEDESPGPWPAVVAKGDAKRPRSATTAAATVIEIPDDD
ncbi:hypothetical protein FZEAL_9343 [Fusarium zealandicum]|uniref:SP-RING-type domain-containing protein n=1 Tax=Fusarium zealandicum TaxID=1053134 RepID=A0A8H4XGA9_9HYPO|nr:hypothetical protein FZEAL_9343 [Fusarium zealandicum]